MSVSLVKPVNLVKRPRPAVKVSLSKSTISYIKAV